LEVDPTGCLDASAAYLLGPHHAAERARAVNRARAEEYLSRDIARRTVELRKIEAEMRRAVDGPSTDAKSKGTTDVSGDGRAAAGDAGGASVSSVQELFRKAQALTVRMEELNRRHRAGELAKLLGSSVEDESTALRAPAGRRQEPDPEGLGPQALDEALADLEQRGQAALRQQRARAARDRLGVTVDTSQGAGAVGGGGGAEREFGGRDPYRRTFTVDQPPPPPVRTDVLRGEGRVFGPGGSYAERIYLDRWYIIGPFPNEHRRNIETRFPPEFGVDLDAEYLGKDDRLLHWKYFEADSYPLVPPDDEPYAVYYGYTEVMMDRERDLWVSFGSDDESKVWLNDALVWESGTGFKLWYNSGGYRSLPSYMRDWNLTENRRRLHFRKGRNRLLFRLENGYGLQFFSMVIEAGAKGHSRSGP
jgi:hypothetical protein